MKEWHVTLALRYKSSSRKCEHRGKEADDSCMAPENQLLLISYNVMLCSKFNGVVFIFITYQVGYRTFSSVQGNSRQDIRKKIKSNRCHRRQKTYSSLLLDASRGLPAPLYNCPGYETERWHPEGHRSHSLRGTEEDEGSS